MAAHADGGAKFVARQLLPLLKCVDLADGRELNQSTLQLNVSTFCGIRSVPSVERWVIARHEMDTKRLTDQNGLG